MKRKAKKHECLSLAELGRLTRTPTLSILLDAYSSLENIVKDMDEVSNTRRSLCERFFGLMESVVLEALISRVFIETFCNELAIKRVFGLREVMKTLESAQADAYVDWNSIFEKDSVIEPKYLLLQFKATINRRPFFKMTKHYEGHLVVFVQVSKDFDVEVFCVPGNQLTMHDLPYLLVFDDMEEPGLKFGQTLVRLSPEQYRAGSKSELCSKVLKWENEFVFKATTDKCNIIQSPESTKGLFGELEVLKLLDCGDGLCAEHPIVNQLPFDMYIHHSGKRWTAQIRTMTIPTGRTWIAARIDRGGDRWNVLMVPDYFIYVLVEGSHVIALLVLTRKELLQRRFLHVPKRCVVDNLVVGPTKGTMRFPVPHPKVHGYLRARYASNIIMVQFDETGMPTCDTKHRIESFFFNKKPNWLIDQEVKFRDISHDFVLPSSTECIKVSIQEVVFNLQAMNCEVQYHDGLERSHANLEVSLPTGEKLHWMVLGINIDIRRRASFEKFETVDLGFEFKKRHADEVVVCYWSTVLGRVVGLDRFSSRFVQRNNGTLRVKPPKAPKYRNPGNRHAIWVKMF